MWSLTSKNPFDELKNIQKELNKVFGTYGFENNSYPAVNIYGNEDNIIFKVELPGINKENINISVHENSITIEGIKSADALNEDEKCFRQERSSGKFIRSFTLPYDVDNEKVFASYKDGLLTITLPRIETSKPKKISIKSE